MRGLIYVSGEFEYDINEQLTVSLSASYEQRSDNGSRYNDKTTHDIFFEAEYEVNDAFIVEFEIDYLDRSFDNNVIDNSGIDEPTRSKEAWTCSQIWIRILARCGDGAQR